jgi:hypothetical protein
VAQNNPHALQVGRTITSMSVIIGFTLFGKSHGIQGHRKYSKPSYSLEETFPSMFLPAEAVTSMTSSRRWLRFPFPFEESRIERWLYEEVGIAMYR